MTARYLDVPATAKYLSLTETAVRRMIDKRDIPYIKVGRRVRFDMQDLDLWMRRQRVEAS